MKTRIVLLFAALAVLGPVFAQEQGAGTGTAGPLVASIPNPDFVRGEELFIRNMPAEALPFLEKAFVADQTDLEGALYLAMCYEQLDKLDEAITIYRRILPTGGDESARIAFNLGNIYFKKGSNSSAEQFYTQAIRTDPAFASAYLNRANTRIKTASLRDALGDYERYLYLEPQSPKRPQIERLIGLIQEEFASEEIRRLMAEESARAAEETRRLAAEEAARVETERRLAAEESIRVEAERRQRVMDEVSASLQAQAEEGEGVSAGAENLSGYEGEFELE
jgi:tetratricopeptide (TPR) repeat protein